MPTQTNPSPKDPFIAPTNNPNPPPSTITTATLRTLSVLRLVAGTAALLAPTTTGKLFLIPTIAPRSMAAYQLRLFGIRDAVIGGMLYCALPKGTEQVEEWKESGRGRMELRRAVWANVVTDAVDIVVTGLAMANGGIGRAGGLCVGGAAVGFLVMGLVGLGTV